MNGVGLGKVSLKRVGEECVYGAGGYLQRLIHAPPDDQSRHTLLKHLLQICRLHSRVMLCTVSHIVIIIIQDAI